MDIYTNKYRNFNGSNHQINKRCIFDIIKLIETITTNYNKYKLRIDD